MKRNILVLVLMLLIGATNAQQTGYFTTQLDWTNTSGTQTRSLRVYVPANYDSNTVYSLLIGFHGLGGNPTTYLQNINYYALNPYFGNVILACPNDGTPGTSWFSGSEDFKIISAIINHLDATYSLDLSKVFVQGFSFGGKSVYLHGLDEADYLKGIIAHSPGFYNKADINNTSTDPTHCQHKYNYLNSWKVSVSITAGSGEYNLGLTEPYLALAKKAVVKLNISGGDAIFIEDPTGYHNLPPISIVKQCWDHVNKPISNINDVIDIQKYSFYPNPATDEINFETNENSNSKFLIVLNIAGLVVNKVEFTGNKISIPVSDLSNGIYYFKLYNKNGEFLYVDKFIVLH